MPRLIDADALIADIEVFCDMYEVNWTIGGVRAWIGSATTIEAEPVKHGRWILHDNGSGTCDQCRFTQKNVWDDDNQQNYCGVCGAKMDGGDAG